MLDRVRSKIASYLLAVGKGFSRVSSSPTLWTCVGLGFALLAGGAYWRGGKWGGEVAGLFILVSGFFDIVDGAVARVTQKVSKRGAFLDSTLDRVAEVAVFLGILEGGLADGPLVLAALSLSLLVSYTRAKADALGASLAGVGIGERSERLLVLAIASLVGFAHWGVVVVCVIAGVTFLERVYRAAASLG